MQSIVVIHVVAKIMKNKIWGPGLWHMVYSCRAIVYDTGAHVESTNTPKSIIWQGSHQTEKVRENLQK